MYFLYKLFCCRYLLLSKSNKKSDIKNNYLINNNGL